VTAKEKLISRLEQPPHLVAATSVSPPNINVVPPRDALYKVFSPAQFPSPQPLAHLTSISNNTMVATLLQHLAQNLGSSWLDAMPLESSNVGSRIWQDKWSIGFDNPTKSQDPVINGLPQSFRNSGIWHEIYSPTGMSKLI